MSCCSIFRLHVIVPVSVSTHPPFVCSNLSRNGPSVATRQLRSLSPPPHPPPENVLLRPRHRHHRPPPFSAQSSRVRLHVLAVRTRTGPHPPRRSPRARLPLPLPLPPIPNPSHHVQGLQPPSLSPTPMVVRRPTPPRQAEQARQSGSSRRHALSSFCRSAACTTSTGTATLTASTAGLVRR